MNGNTLNYISYLNLIYDSKMCGWFAGQFSRDNRRDIYMQWTDLLCILSFPLLNRLSLFASLSPASASAERHS